MSFQNRTNPGYLLEFLVIIQLTATTTITFRGIIIKQLTYFGIL